MDGVRSIFFYNSEAELGTRVGLHLFEPRYRLMLHRAMTSGRPKEIIFLPNYQNYVAAHGDVGFLATIVSYSAWPVSGLASSVTELPRADVTLRFDARVMVLFHWMAPHSGGLHECVSTSRRLSE